MAAATSSTAMTEATDGLRLQPLRAARPAVTGPALASRLCPPYDVIDAGRKAHLLEHDEHNFVAIALPDPTPAGYSHAAAVLQDAVDTGAMAVDATPTLYVYEITTPDGHVTRGLVGAIELRDPADGVILPHENTMAGPVADRLALMTATDADLEPIYLLYDGAGAATAAVAAVDLQAVLTETTTEDGVTHRLWSIDDPDAIATIQHDLRSRRAVIADGHHRYATYRERQRLRAAEGAGPWDFGLTLLVDSSVNGPQVHPIHRVVHDFTLTEAVDRLRGRCTIVDLHVPNSDADAGDLSPDEQLARRAERELASMSAFAAVVTDGDAAVLVRDDDGALLEAAARAGDPDALVGLDVTVLHRSVIEGAWAVPDDVDHVGYAHSAREALDQARARNGVAVLVRPTPAAAVAAVAAAGARMPRKSTLFTPKPASGLFVRRLRDQL